MRCRDDPYCALSRRLLLCAAATTGTYAAGVRSRRPDPEPLDVDAVSVVTAGTVAWAVALVAALVGRSTLRAHGHSWWIQACLAGFLLGLLGIGYCRRRRAALDQAAPPPAESAGGVLGP